MHIPRRLLIHSVTLKRETGKDRDRNAVYDESTLRSVRVGITRRVQAGAHGTVRADTMTLFVDAHNSESVKDGQKTALIVPKENDVIGFYGKEYAVKAVTPCYAAVAKAPDDGASHWEVALE